MSDLTSNFPVYDETIVQQTAGRIPWFHNCCKSKNAVVAEYALRNVNKSIGVAMRLTREIETALPQEFQYCLPTVEEIEAELATNDEEITE